MDEMSTAFSAGGSRCHVSGQQNVLWIKIQKNKHTVTCD